MLAERLSTAEVSSFHGVMTGNIYSEFELLFQFDSFDLSYFGWCDSSDRLHPSNNPELGGWMMLSSSKC